MLSIAVLYNREDMAIEGSLREIMLAKMHALNNLSEHVTEV